MASPHARTDLPDPPKNMPREKVRALLMRLLGLAKPEWKSLAWGVVLLAVGSAASLAFPQAIRVLLDGALADGDQRQIDLAAMVMGVVFLVQGVAAALRYVVFQNAGERVVARLRKRLFSSLLNQDIGFFDAQRTGELTNRLSADTTVLQNAVSANISMLLRNLAAVVGGVALLVWTSPKLTLLMLSVVPAVAIGAAAFGKRVRKLSKEVQDTLAAGTAVAEETLSGIRTVRAFAAESREAGRYGATVDHSYEVARKRASVAGAFFGGAMFFAFGSAALVLWYGGRLVLADAMTVGELTSFLIYTMLVAFSLGAVAELWTDFMRAAGAAERLFELLDRTPAVPSSGGQTLEKVDGRVRFSQVAFAYPTRPDLPVLRSLSLDIEPGEIVALVGPSGAGKSTLGALLQRFYDPTQGTVSVDGHDLRELDPSWLRRQIGVVSQEPLLFSSSVADNIRYGRPDATDEEVERAARVANAHEFIARFPDGYRTLVGERGVQLSGGQKQRVAIARAVLKDPRLLVLDEATSALDAESEHLVQEALDRLLEGRTTIVIAHRLSTVADADRVVVLEDGGIVQQGPHAQLVREDGLYKRLVERQFVAA